MFTRSQDKTLDSSQETLIPFPGEETLNSSEETFILFPEEETVTSSNKEEALSWFQREEALIPFLSDEAAFILSSNRDGDLDTDCDSKAIKDDLNSFLKSPGDEFEAFCAFVETEFKNSEKSQNLAVSDYSAKFQSLEKISPLKLYGIDMFLAHLIKKIEEIKFTKNGNDFINLDEIERNRYDKIVQFLFSKKDEYEIQDEKDIRLAKETINYIVSKYIKSEEYLKKLQKSQELQKPMPNSKSDSLERFIVGKDLTEFCQGLNTIRYAFKHAQDNYSKIHAKKEASVLSEFSFFSDFLEESDSTSEVNEKTSDGSFFNDLEII